MISYILIKPVVKVDKDFAENLLEELIAAGLRGEELVAKFKEGETNYTEW